MAYFYSHRAAIAAGVVAAVGYLVSHGAVSADVAAVLVPVAAYVAAQITHLATKPV